MAARWPVTTTSFTSGEDDDEVVDDGGLCCAWAAPAIKAVASAMVAVVVK